MKVESSFNDNLLCQLIQLFTLCSTHILSVYMKNWKNIQYEEVYIQTWGCYCQKLIIGNNLVVKDIPCHTLAIKCVIERVYNLFKVVMYYL